MRSHFRFTIIDLACMTVVVAFAAQIARNSDWVDGLVIGVVLFALWSTAQMIYGLFIRKNDEFDSAAFYQAWVVKFLLMAFIQCVIISWLRSVSLLK